MNHSQNIEKLINICHRNLKNSKQCLKYLKSRGLSKQEILSNKIGYFPQNMNMLLKYIPEEPLNKASILDYSRNSDFLNYFYLIFPIYSEFGQAIGISGRTLLEDTDRVVISIPKYKNSSYKKADILYGLNSAKEKIINSNNAYVLEGYFDQISMVRNGFDNSVAICGTAFSQNHFLKLLRYTDKITFILDSDDAGKKSVIRIYKRYINKGAKLRFLSLPEPYKDVDEYFADPSKNKNTFNNEFKQIIPDTW
jgi:DNA primase